MSLGIDYNTKKRKFETAASDLASLSSQLQTKVSEFTVNLNAIKSRNIHNIFSYWMIMIFGLAVGSLLLIIVNPFLVFLPIILFVIMSIIFIVHQSNFRKFKNAVRETCEKWKHIFAVENLLIDNKIDRIKRFNENAMKIFLRPSFSANAKTCESVAIPIYQLSIVNAVQTPEIIPFYSPSPIPIQKNETGFIPNYKEEVSLYKLPDVRTSQNIVIVSEEKGSDSNSFSVE